MPDTVLDLRDSKILFIQLEEMYSKIKLETIV